MSYFTMYAIVAVFACQLAVSPCSYGQEQRWGIEATLSKNEYVLREPIWLDITLTNITADTQRTDGLITPNAKGFAVELKDDSGHTLQSRWLGHWVPGPGSLLLKPGQQDFACVNLAQEFGVIVEGESNLMNLEFPTIPCGAYRVLVRFEEAISTELSFQVVEPSGEANEALELINQADAEWKHGNDPAASVKFKVAADRFPDGPYAETCYYLSLLYSPELDVKKNFDLVSLRRAMLEKYPDSGSAPDWIKAITQDMEPQAKRVFFENLGKARPDSRAARYAAIALDRLNGEKAGE